MARLIVLGSAAAVSDEYHDNTHLLLEGENSVVLIDCGSNPVVKLKRFGIHYTRLTDMILTHFHPDHVYGVPILLMHMWLLGRENPLRVYGLNHCLERTEDMMLAFSWDTWPRFFPIAFYRVPERPNALVLDNEDFRITSWPVKHFLPTIGLRIEVKSSGKVVGYSCDTEPIPNSVEIGRNADLFLHEAAGAGMGHSSAAQAGEIAMEAGAHKLVLVHYDVWDTDPSKIVPEAKSTFNGPVELAVDYTVYEI
ncbi:MAG: MBL fold metallo-hydrolase [Anaerolineae bacterium]|nr:MBL fold metallo-hydrolase [Anaerolineae bacterium]